MEKFVLEGHGISDYSGDGEERKRISGFPSWRKIVTENGEVELHHVKH